MSWYNNDEGFDQKHKSSYVRRFWMPNDSDRLMTFIDTPIVDLNGVQIQTPFKYNEYQLQLNGHWRNWFTQPFNLEDDVLKDMGYKASKVAALTVVDHSEWTDKKGILHKDEVVLYVVKRSSSIWTQMTKILNREGSLAGKTYRVHRMGDKSPGAGVMLEKHEQNFVLDPSVHVPYNYLELLKPKGKGELEALFNPEPDPFQQGKPDNNQNQGWGDNNGNGWGGTASVSNQNQGWGDTNSQSRVYGTTSQDNKDVVPF